MVYFGTLICPFSTKSLLRLHGFLHTLLFFQSLKKQHKQRTPCIFITEFMLLIKTPPFYEVNSFNVKYLAHGGISKIIFLDHFSPLFVGQKCKNFTHIPFWPGKQWSDLSYTVCYLSKAVREPQREVGIINLMFA